MNKIITFYLVFFSASIIAQSFNLSELEKLSTNNWDDFDTSATKKGYSYYSSNKDEVEESKEYSFQRNNNGKAKFWITKSVYVDGSEMVSWQTNKQSDYVKIKEQIKALGYRFVESKFYNDKNYNRYKKGNKELSLISGVATSDLGIEINYYEISIAKAIK